MPAKYIGVIADLDVEYRRGEYVQYGHFASSLVNDHATTRPDATNLATMFRKESLLGNAYAQGWMEKGVLSTFSE